LKELVLTGLVSLLASPAAAATLHVRVEGIASDEGELKVAVCERTLDEAGCRVGESRAPQGAVEDFAFADLAPGRYAVASYHDLNGNGRLDTGLFGLPSEPYGLSNEAGRYGRPDFADAAVEIGAADARVVVQVAGPLGLR
jgi:uncharacterized protein (DUF2141 family)